MKRAFTLIELMIVVAIIAIIASVAIPSLLRSRIAANETSAIAALKQLVSTEGTWQQTDSDRNGNKDFWTCDVSGFYSVQDANNANLKYIDVAFAKADFRKVAGTALPTRTPKSSGMRPLQASTSSAKSRSTTPWTRSTARWRPWKHPGSSSRSVSTVALTLTSAR